MTTDLDPGLAAAAERWRLAEEMHKEISSEQGRAERRALIEQLRAEGLSLEQIGGLLGVTKQRVWQILSR